MHRLLLALALSAVALAGSPTEARAAPLHPDVLRAKMKSANKASGTEYLSLVRWCGRKKLPGWAERLRARALAFRPDDAKLRGRLGYERVDDRWVANEAKRLEFRETAFGDDVDEGAPEFWKRLRVAERKMARRMRSVALQAKAPEDADQDTKTAFDQIRAEAWRAVLHVDPRNEEAAKALGYPRIGDRHVHPEGLGYLEIRERRQEQAAAAWDADYPLQVNADKGLIPRAWSKVLTVHTTYGLNAAKRFARAGTSARHLFMKEYRKAPLFGRTIRFREITVVKDKAEMKHVLTISTDWDAATINKKVERWGGVSYRGEVVTRKRSLEAALDVVLTYQVRSCYTALQSEAERKVPKAERRDEPWLKEAVAMDLVIRVSGRFESVFSSGKGTSVDRDMDGADAWLAHARLLVELDDDPPMRGIVQRDLNSLGTRESAKAFAFLTYLHERDAGRALKFIALASARGGSAAAGVIYGASLDELDAGYRKWMAVTR